MIRRLVVFSLALWPTMTGAAEPRSITLEEALRRCGDLSPAGRVVALAVERARAEVSAAGLWPNPELSLTREESAGTVETFENLSVPIVLSGRLGLERDSSKLGWTAGEEAARQDLVSLRGRVREAFLSLLQAQQTGSAMEAGRSRLVELAQALRVREREGESSGFDRIRAERELADLEADLLQARGDLEGARSALAALVALPVEGLSAVGTLDPSGALPDRESLRSRAQARGDLLALDAQAARADLLAKAAHRRAVPEPAITVGRKITEADGAEDSGPVLGLAFAIPLFDRGQGQRGTATAEAALLRARREDLARQVAAEAEAAYAEVVTRREAEARYAAAGDPEELIAIARAAYDGGAMRILELIDAYHTALAARLRLLELSALARKAEVRLGRAIGAEVFP